MSDRIFGVFGIILALGFAYSATLIEESFLSDVVGPKAFPLIVAAVLGLSSLFMILKPDPDPAWPDFARIAEIAAAVVMMLLYAQLLPVVGFVFATAVAAAYLSWRLGNKILWAVVTGIGTSVGIYGIFHLVLGLSLARGPLGF